MVINSYLEQKATIDSVSHHQSSSKSAQNYELRLIFLTAIPLSLGTVHQRTSSEDVILSSDESTQ